MKLQVCHTTSYRYDPAAPRVGLRLRLYPSQFDSQRRVSWSVSVNGAAVAPMLVDAFGDEQSLWTSQVPCESVEIVAGGVVETSDTAGVVSGLAKKPPVAVFRRETALTSISPAIRDLARDCAADVEATLDRMHALCHGVHEAVAYRSGVTSANTSAAQAMTLGAGVCQDHAHIFLAGARSLGVPARYIAGYMVVDERDDELRETHAWAEAYIDDLGWVGFDPSTGRCPTDHYIRLACGLDASEAAPVRGSVGGDAAVGLEAAVTISRAQQ